MYGIGGICDRGTCMAGGCMVGGHAWQGVCVAGGSCMVGGMHVGGHAWWGACMLGGMHGRGMHGRGHACHACPPALRDIVSQCAGITHPTGMHSCFNCVVSISDGLY